MQKQQNSNISSLEVEIENKISMAYLYSIAAKTTDLQISRLFKERFTNSPTKPSKSTNSKTTEK